jgi:hypothetical protein
MERFKYEYQFLMPAEEFNALHPDKKRFQADMYTQNILGTLWGMIHVAPANSDIVIHINLNVLNSIHLPEPIVENLVTKDLIISVVDIGSGDGVFFNKNSF